MSSVADTALNLHSLTPRGGVWGAFQYQKISLPKISLPKMSFGLVQSGWGESECFCKNLAPGSCEVFKDIFRAYRNAPQETTETGVVTGTNLPEHGL